MSDLQKIENFMTSLPHSINSDLPLKAAKEMMKKYDVRHLPVQAGGQLVGVLSDRDLKLALSFSETDSLVVKDVMTPEPYAVSPGASLQEVVQKMAEKKFGCTLITDSHAKVIGIFTANDGLQAFAETLAHSKKQSQDSKRSSR